MEKSNQKEKTFESMKEEVKKSFSADKVLGNILNELIDTFESFYNSSLENQEIQAEDMKWMFFLLLQKMFVLAEFTEKYLKLDKIVFDEYKKSLTPDLLKEIIKTNKNSKKIFDFLLKEGVLLKNQQGGYSLSPAIKDFLKLYKKNQKVVNSKNSETNFDLSSSSGAVIKGEKVKKKKYKFKPLGEENKLVKENTSLKEELQKIKQENEKLNKELEQMKKEKDEQEKRLQELLAKLKSVDGKENVRGKLKEENKKNNFLSEQSGINPGGNIDLKA